VKRSSIEKNQEAQRFPDCFSKSGKGSRLADFLIASYLLDHTSSKEKLYLRSFGYRYIDFRVGFLQSEKNSGYFLMEAIAFFGRFFSEVPAV
jgi:hypothetical protein